MFLIYANHGYRADIFYVKQKALTGPLKNIYCMYSDGRDYNAAAELLSKYVTQDDVLLCAETHTIWYLLTDAQIGHYSTISTIDYGDRLETYWDIFPEKCPNYVLGRRDSYFIDMVRRLLSLEEYAVEEDMALYKVTGRNP